MRVEYHPDTVDDLNNAIDYYESRRSGLGSEFRQEIYQTIDRIAADPYLFRTVSGEVRRCFVHRFPFSILYRMSTHQRPGATRMSMMTPSESWLFGTIDNIHDLASPDHETHHLPQNVDDRTN